jgi:hypothetical protein
MLEIITKRLPSLYVDIPALRPGTVGAYALAFVSVGIATALRLVLVHISWVPSSLRSSPQS